MNSLTSNSLLLLSTLALSTTQVSAQASTKFICGTVDNVPTTLAQTPRGDVPIIRWVSDYFSGTGYTPQQRCKEVSRRFQKYYADGSLKYLIPGEVNGLPVICTAVDNKNEQCKNVLFTLKKGADPSTALKNLSSVKNKANTILSESGENHPQVTKNYVDIEELINGGVEK